MNGINIVNLICPDCFHPVRVHGLQTHCIAPDCECKHTYAGAGMLALQAQNDALRHEFRKSLQMVALAVSDNEHGWKKEHVKMLHDYLGEHLDVLTGDGV
jgi:hypothetical protein